jgi:hypothetical protein
MAEKDFEITPKTYIFAGVGAVILGVMGHVALGGGAASIGAAIVGALGGGALGLFF